MCSWNILYPYIYIHQGLVETVSDSFALLTDYTQEDLYHLDIIFVLNDMLRINHKIKQLDELESYGSFFTFNKMLDFKQVDIEVSKEEGGEGTYLIFKQQPLISIDNPLSYTHQLISNNMMGIALFYAGDYTLLKASREYERIMYDRHRQRDIIGKKIYEFNTLWNEDLSKQQWNQVKKTRQAMSQNEVLLLNPQTGKQQYYDIGIMPIIDNDETKYLVVTLNEVTDKVNYRLENEKKTQFILRQKNLMEAVLENQKESIYIVDRTGNIVISNNAVKGRFAPAQLRSIKDIYNASEIYDENGKRLCFEELPAYLVTKGKSIDNFKLKTVQKGVVTYLNVNGGPILHDEGSYDYSFICAADITEVVESRQRLIEEKEKLEAIMDNISDILLIFDKDDNIIMRNGAANAYMSYDIKSLTDIYKQASFFEVDGGAVAYEDYPCRQIKRGMQIFDRVLLVKAGGRSMYFSLSAKGMFDEDKNYVMGVISIRNITDYISHSETIRRQQLALLEAEKREKENLEKILVMKDEFLSLISHEFKTPLTVINATLQVIELVHKDQLSEKMKGYLQKIKQNTFRQVRLVNNILDTTKAKANQIKMNLKNHDIVFVTRCILESVKLYADQKQIAIYFESEFHGKLIAMDEEKYERILLNLLSNAIKFSPHNKTIAVTISGAPEKIVIQVADEGIGIPEDKLYMIFERFGQIESTYTRQAEGSGIGLYLVKMLVDAMGGQIMVQSSLEKGSVFRIELPDMTTKDEEKGTPINPCVDDRLIQGIAIEFSDIYF
jgi:signal transduction histidine kinase